MNSRKIIIVVIVVIVSIGLIINTHKNLEGTKVEEIEEKTKSLFAIKVENESGKYEDSTTFPGVGYSLNISLTECVDQMENKVSNVKITGNGTNVTVTSKYNVYCTIYFNKEKTLTQFCNGVDLKTCINSKKDYIGDVANMTTSLVGGMYRYQGTNDVNNYICFGTTNQSTCTSNADKYMYRIIGVTPEGELKLIKQTVITEKSGSTTYTVFSWNDNSRTSNCGDDGSQCTWPLSRLFNRINGLCKSDNINCLGTGTGEDGQTNIFINSEYYDYLTSDSPWESKINYHIWKYGDSKELDSYNGNNAYIIENAFTASVPNAKIGLQYIHDYYYAYPGGNPGSGTNARNAWIHLSKNGTYGISYEWLISRYVVDSTYVDAWLVFSLGDVRDSRLDLYGVGVRPVFYLKSDIKIKSGIGSKTDPYILDV